MKRSTLVLVIGALALTALAVPQGRLELEARLNSKVMRAKGKATWKVRDGRSLQAELEVEGENLLRNTDYTVIVGDNAPISVSTNGLGSFEFSARYTGQNRPVIAAGDQVTLEDAGERTVLSGVLQPR